VGSPNGASRLTFNGTEPIVITSSRVVELTSAVLIARLVRHTGVLSRHQGGLSGAVLAGLAGQLDPFATAAFEDLRTMADLAQLPQLPCRPATADDVAGFVAALQRVVGTRCLPAC
jgi:hypothetical protein